MALVVAHTGYSPYLEFTLRQARAASPSSDLILLGDPSNDRFPFVHHVDTTTARYRAAAADIGAVYRHMSSNRSAFELSCFERWFRIREFVESEGLGEVLALDSDVLLYSPEAEIHRTHLAGATMGVSHPRDQEDYAWTTSPHVSFWTAPRLSDYCDFIVRSYADDRQRAPLEEKWRHHLDTGARGGVCDMTALHLYAGARGGAELPDGVANLVAVRDRTAFDLNFSVPNNEWRGEYAMSGPTKAIHWEDGQPHGRSVQTGESVRFHGLHLQGHAKAKIPAMYRGPAFPSMDRIRRQLRVQYAAREVASRVLQPARLLGQRLRGG